MHVVVFYAGITFLNFFNMKSFQEKLSQTKLKLVNLFAKWRWFDEKLYSTLTIYNSSHQCIFGSRPQFSVKFPWTALTVKLTKSPKLTKKHTWKIKLIHYIYNLMKFKSNKYQNLFPWHSNKSRPHFHAKFSNWPKLFLKRNEIRKHRTAKS